MGKISIHGSLLREDAETWRKEKGVTMDFLFYKAHISRSTFYKNCNADIFDPVKLKNVCKVIQKPVDTYVPNPISESSKYPHECTGETSNPEPTPTTYLRISNLVRIEELLTSIDESLKVIAETWK